jgi:hypothetical protein|tara:strand:+ start:239 stop:406 length:168 start_codon:yes stop_codon:yes gene_type:complete
MIHIGALSNPTNLMGIEKAIAGKGPERRNGSSGRESHNGGIVKEPFSARLMATPQ